MAVNNTDQLLDDLKRAGIGGVGIARTARGSALTFDYGGRNKGRLKFDAYEEGGRTVYSVGGKIFGGMETNNGFTYTPEQQLTSALKYALGESDVDGHSVAVTSQHEMMPRWQEKTSNLRGSSFSRWSSLSPIMQSMYANTFEFVNVTGASQREFRNQADVRAQRAGQESFSGLKAGILPDGYSSMSMTAIMPITKRAEQLGLGVETAEDGGILLGGKPLSDITGKLGKTFKRTMRERVAIGGRETYSFQERQYQVIQAEFGNSIGLGAGQAIASESFSRSVGYTEATTKTKRVEWGTLDQGFKLDTRTHYNAGDEIGLATFERDGKPKRLGAAQGGFYGAVNVERMLNVGSRSGVQKELERLLPNMKGLIQQGFGHLYNEKERAGASGITGYATRGEAVDAAQGEVFGELAGALGIKKEQIQFQASPTISVTATMNRVVPIHSLKSLDTKIAMGYDREQSREMDVRGVDLKMNPFDDMKDGVYARRKIMTGIALATEERMVWDKQTNRQVPTAEENPYFAMKQDLLAKHPEFDPASKTGVTTAQVDAAWNEYKPQIQGLLDRGIGVPWAIVNGEAAPPEYKGRQVLTLPEMRALNQLSPVLTRDIIEQSVGRNPKLSFYAALTNRGQTNIFEKGWGGIGTTGEGGYDADLDVAADALKHVGVESGAAFRVGNVTLPSVDAMRSQDSLVMQRNYIKALGSSDVKEAEKHASAVLGDLNEMFQSENFRKDMIKFRGVGMFTRMSSYQKGEGARPDTMAIGSNGEYELKEGRPAYGPDALVIGRNEADVLARGMNMKRDQFVDWLQQEPRYANVNRFPVTNEQAYIKQLHYDPNQRTLPRISAMSAIAEMGDWDADPYGITLLAKRGGKGRKNWVNMEGAGQAFADQAPLDQRAMERLVAIGGDEALGQHINAMKAGMKGAGIERELTNEDILFGVHDPKSGTYIEGFNPQINGNEQNVVVKAMKAGFTDVNGIVRTGQRTATDKLSEAVQIKVTAKEAAVARMVDESHRLEAGIYNMVVPIQQGIKKLSGGKRDILQEAFGGDFKNTSKRAGRQANATNIINSSLSNLYQIPIDLGDIGKVTRPLLADYNYGTGPAGAKEQSQRAKSIAARLYQSGIENKSVLPQAVAAQLVDPDSPTAVEDLRAIRDDVIARRNGKTTGDFATAEAFIGNIKGTERSAGVNTVEASLAVNHLAAVADGREMDPDEKKTLDVYAQYQKENNPQWDAVNLQRRRQSSFENWALAAERGGTLTHDAIFSKANETGINPAAALTFAAEAVKRGKAVTTPATEARLPFSESLNAEGSAIAARLKDKTGWNLDSSSMHFLANEGHAFAPDAIVNAITGRVGGLLGAGRDSKGLIQKESMIFERGKQFETALREKHGAELGYSLKGNDAFLYDLGNDNTLTMKPDFLKPNASGKGTTLPDAKFVTQEHLKDYVGTADKPGYVGVQAGVAYPVGMSQGLSPMVTRRDGTKAPNKFLAHNKEVLARMEAGGVAMTPEVQARVIADAEAGDMSGAIYHPVPLADGSNPDPVSAADNYQTTPIEWSGGQTPADLHRHADLAIANMGGAGGTVGLQRLGSVLKGFLGTTGGLLVETARNIFRGITSAEKTHEIVANKNDVISGGGSSAKAQQEMLMRATAAGNVLAGKPATAPRAHGASGSVASASSAGAARGRATRGWGGRGGAVASGAGVTGDWQKETQGDRQITQSDKQIAQGDKQIELLERIADPGKGKRGTVGNRSNNVLGLSAYINKIYNDPDYVPPTLDLMDQGFGNQEVAFLQKFGQVLQGGMTRSEISDMEPLLREMSLGTAWGQDYDLSASRAGLSPAQLAEVETIDSGRKIVAGTRDMALKDSARAVGGTTPLSRNRHSTLLAHAGAVGAADALNSEALPASTPDHIINKSGEVVTKLVKNLEEAAKSLEVFSKAVNGTTAEQEQAQKDIRDRVNTAKGAREFYAQQAGLAQDLMTSGTEAASSTDETTIAAGRLSQRAAANIMSNLGKGGTVHSLVAQAHGDDVADNIADEMVDGKTVKNGFAQTADRLMSGYFGFQMLRTLRYTFNPITQAAARNAERESGYNQGLGQAGLASSRADDNAQRWQTMQANMDIGLGQQAGGMLGGFARMTGADGAGNLGRGLLGTAYTVASPAAGAGMITYLGLNALKPALGPAIGGLVTKLGGSMGIAAGVTGVTAAISAAAYVIGASADQDAKIRGALNANNPNQSIFGDIQGSIAFGNLMGSADINANPAEGGVANKRNNYNQLNQLDKFLISKSKSAWEAVKTNPLGWGMQDANRARMAISSVGVDGTMLNTLGKEFNLNEDQVKNLAIQTLGTGASADKVDGLVRRFAEFTDLGRTPQSVLQDATTYQNARGIYDPGKIAESLLQDTSMKPVDYQRSAINSQLGGGIGSSLLLAQSGIYGSTETTDLNQLGKIVEGWGAQGPQVAASKQAGAAMALTYKKLTGKSAVPAQFASSAAAEQASYDGVTGDELLSLAAEETQLAGYGDDPTQIAGHIGYGNLADHYARQQEVRFQRKAGGASGLKQLTQYIPESKLRTMFGGQFGSEKAQFLAGVGSQGMFNMTKMNGLSAEQISSYGNSPQGQMMLNMASQLTPQSVGFMQMSGMAQPGSAVAQMQPMMDMSTGAGLFQRSMWGLNGNYAPSNQQIGSFISSTIATQTPFGRNSWTSSSAASQQSAINAISGKTYGVGGIQGAQMGINAIQWDVSERLQNAGAALSAKSARLQHDFTVEVEQPQQWARMQMSRAKAFGGSVDAETQAYFAANGITSPNYSTKLFDKGGALAGLVDTAKHGTGQFAMQWAQLALEEQGQMASASQGMTRMGWQMQDLNRSQAHFQIQTGWQRQDMQTGRSRQLTQRGWQQQDFAVQAGEIALSHQYSAEDYGFSKQMRSLQFGWQMEDADEGIRRSTGYQRKVAVRQRDRAVEMNNLEGGQEDRLRKRQVEAEKREDAAFKKQTERHKVQNRWEDEDFQKQKDRFDTQTQWSEEEFNQKRERLQQEMAWAGEAFARTAAGMEIRKEQLRIEEEEAKATFDMADLRFKKEKDLELEKFKMSQIILGMTKQEQLDIETLNKSIQGMREEEAKRMEKMNKAMIDFYNGVIDWLVLQGMTNLKHIPGGSEAVIPAKVKQVKANANGGALSNENWNIVGEAGAEIVVPNGDGSHVIPSRYLSPRGNNAKSGGSIRVEATVPVMLDGKVIATALVDFMVDPVQKQSRRSYRR